MYVGIDISKETFDVCFLDSEKVSFCECNMNREGFDKFATYLLKYNKENVYICLEATGIYYYNLADYLLSLGYNSTVENAYLIKHYALGLSLRALKNDKQDARKCAYYCKMLETEGWFKQYKKEEIEDLRSYIRYIDTLKRNASKIKTRICSKITILFPEYLKIVSKYDSITSLQFLRVAPSARLLRENPNLLENIKINPLCKYTKEDILNASKISVGCIRPAEEFILVDLIEELFQVESKIEVYLKLVENITNLNNGLKDNINILSSIKGIAPGANGSAIRFLAETGIYGFNIRNFFSKFKRINGLYGMCSK